MLQLSCNVIFSGIIEGAAGVDLDCDISVYLSTSIDKESSIFPKRVIHILFVSV